MDKGTLQDLKWSIEDEIAQYVDEYILPKLERLIDVKLLESSNDRQLLTDEIKAELVYEMYKMKKELEDKIQMNSKVTKKSFWKWWK